MFYVPLLVHTESIKISNLGEILKMKLFALSSSDIFKTRFMIQFAADMTHRGILWTGWAIWDTSKSAMYDTADKPKTAERLS